MSKDFRDLTREYLAKYKVPVKEVEGKGTIHFHYKVGNERCRIVAYNNEVLFYICTDIFGAVRCEKELESSIANLSDLF